MTHATTTQTKKANRYLAGLMAALATMAAIVALSALSAHASAKQGVSGSGKKQEASLATTSSTSTTPKASFASGSGDNFLGVKVSDHGNLMSFESPQGVENVFSNAEGYAVCSDVETDVRKTHGHDTGSMEAGFGAPTFSQPNGTGTFPLTVTRKTTDGRFQLTQVWNKPDATEKDVTVAMTLKNISGATISHGVLLSRSGDFDAGSSSSDLGATTGASTWQWDDVGAGVDSSKVGTMLSALSFGTTHLARVESRSGWVLADGTRTGCLANNLATPTSAQDLAMRVTYDLGDLIPGQSKTVKFEYERM
jgi:hypothetical protein